MILTEAEAKTRWCPFGRVPADRNDVLSGSVNRSPMWSSASNCIGSACMAFRWFHDEADKGKPLPLTHGYCGLAGKP